MAGVDVANSVLYELRGPLIDSFEQKNPLFDWLQRRGQVSTEKAKYIEGGVMGGSSAQATGVYQGGEVLDTTRTEQSHNWQIKPHRLVSAISIPKLDLEYCEGRAAVTKLMKKYPVSHVAGLANDFDRFFLTGVSNGVSAQTSEMQGWNTLNGQKTWTRGVLGVANGAMRFEAPSSQTTAFQALARSSAYYWYNQWASSASSATVKAVVKKLHRLASRNKGKKGPDIIWCDDDTYAVFEERQDAQVRLVKVQNAMDETGESSNTEIPIYNAKLMAAQNLILTDFTAGTDAASGVCYGLTSEDIELIWYKKATMSDFDDRIANQDAVIAKYEMMFAVVFNLLTTHFAATGTARP